MPKRNLLQLRISQNDHNNPEYIEELLDLLDETKTFDEIWLATNYGLCSMDEIRQEVPNMRRALEAIRRRGIIGSMQISRTVGHAPTLMKTQSTEGLRGVEYNFCRRFDGSIATGRICYTGEGFRAYVREAMGEWGRAGAEIAWVDDDVRLWTFGNAFCFCDTCIKKFNKKCKYNFTFESFREAFLAGDAELRERYHDFQVEELGEFARIIAEGIKESSPETVMGLQQGGTLPLAAASQAACLGAFLDVTDKAPTSRVGGGFYDDHNPEEMLKKALKSNFMVSRLPDFVKLRTVEIENLPFVSYGKSTECSSIEAALYTAYGCNAASVTLMNQSEPLSYHKKIFESLSRYRPYLESAVEHNEGTYVGGLCTYQPKKSHLATHGDSPELVWQETVIWQGVKLMRLGIPLNAEPKGGIYYLSAAACNQVCDEDMETLLRSPVILDGTGLATLVEMGYGEKLGATAVPVDDEYKLVTYELPTDHKINKGGVEGRYSDSFYYSKDTQYLIEGEGIEPVHDCYSSQFKTKIGVASAVITTAYGAKWFVKGRALANPVIPMHRRNMLIRAINYISDTPLCAYVKSYGQIVCVPRVDSYGKVVSVTLLNASISECEDVEVAIASPVGEGYRLTDPYRLTEHGKLEREGEYFVASVGSLAPWRVKTILIDKQ